MIGADNFNAFSFLPFRSFGTHPAAPVVISAVLVAVHPLFTVALGPGFRPPCCYEKPRSRNCRKDKYIPYDSVHCHSNSICRNTVAALYKIQKTCLNCNTAALAGVDMRIDIVYFI